MYQVKQSEFHVLITHLPISNISVPIKLEQRSNIVIQMTNTLSIRNSWIHDEFQKEGTCQERREA